MNPIDTVTPRGQGCLMRLPLALPHRSTCALPSFVDPSVHQAVLDSVPLPALGGLA